MSLGTIGLACLAGVLSVLSPCVLPLLPIVLGTAQSENRLGPIALSAGLALSFVAIGLFVATIGFAAGLDTGFFRAVSAVLLIAVGVLLLVPRLQEQFALAAGPVSNFLGDRFESFTASGLARPIRPSACCSEPCGARAWGPRSAPPRSSPPRARTLGQVALTMLAFGLGAALPLMLLGLLSREAMMRWRGRLMEAGKGGKMLLGVLLVTIGLIVATGLDKRLEAALVDASPQWLTELTTRY